MTTTPPLLGGRYEVVGLLGHGGMAEVYRGVDTRLGRPVAIKVLRADLARDSTFLGRFRREAQSAAGLNHPSIVAIYDSGEDSTTDLRGSTVPLPYIVMEVVEGETLRERLTREHTVSPDEAARLTEGVLSALDYSHRMGIVHRDIKPGNVMVTTKGEVKVCDFGIARAVSDSSSTMTQTQAVIGTAQYLSPEQAQGQQVDTRSDLYSTGCLLFELLAGRAPFIGDSPVSVAYQHVGQQPQPPSIFEEGIPSSFDTVTLHALVKDRERRYQSAVEFRSDVAAARTGRPLSAAAAGTAAAALASGAGLTAILAPAGGTTALDAAAVGTGDAAGNGGGSGGGSGTSGAGGPAHDPANPANPADPDPRLDTGGIPVPGRPGEAGRRRGPAYVLITLAVVAALVLVTIAGRALLHQAQRPTEVAVPRVVGSMVEAARATLVGKKFVVDVTTVTNDTAPSGQVVKQSPDAAVLAVEGSTVSLDVSSGPGQVTVPDVSGLSQAEATSTLKGDGIGVRLVDLVDSPAQPKDKVIGTDPAYGAVVKKNSAVTLRISSGKLPVPDVTTKNFSVAQATLTQNGLTSEIVAVDDTTALVGTVLKQDPAPGTIVASGTKVTLTIARAPLPTTQTTTVTTTVTAPPTTPTTPVGSTTSGRTKPVG